MAGLVLAIALLAAAGACAEATAASTVVLALGTQGGPEPNAGRSQPAHALQVQGENYLIDAGNGVTRQLALAGIPVTQVRKIFITHDHDDHNADLGTIMGLSWSLGSMGAYEVFGPASVQQVIDGFRKSYAVNAGIRHLDSPLRRGGRSEGVVNIHAIGPAPAAKIVYRDANVEVTAIENCHYHHGDAVPSELADEKSYAFRFRTNDRVVVFSGDTGPCEPLVAFSKGADVLVHEVLNAELMEKSMRSTGLAAAMPEALLKTMLKRSQQYHTTPEEVGKLATAAGVGMVILTHVMPGNVSEPDEAYTAGVARHYSGKVVVARDLERY